MKQLELPLQCTEKSHNWSNWKYLDENTHVSTCDICKEERYLVPAYYWKEVKSRLDK